MVDNWTPYPTSVVNNQARGASATAEGRGPGGRDHPEPAPTCGSLHSRPGPGYPVTLLLEGRSCLVVGGGSVAERKAAGLVETGARVRVVAERFTPGLQEMAVDRHPRPFRPEDVEGCWLVVSATGRPEVEAAVRQAAEAAGVLVNAADDPASCSVLLPAVLRRGPVTVAVSTTGHSPALASLLRDTLAPLIRPEVAQVAAALAGARDRLHVAGRSTQGRPFKDLARQLLAEATGGTGREGLEALVDAWLAHGRTPG